MQFPESDHIFAIELDLNPVFKGSRGHLDPGVVQEHPRHRVVARSHNHAAADFMKRAEERGAIIIPGAHDRVVESKRIGTAITDFDGHASSLAIHLHFDSEIGMGQELQLGAGSGRLILSLLTASAPAARVGACSRAAIATYSLFRAVFTSCGV